MSSSQTQNLTQQQQKQDIKFQEQQEIKQQFMQQEGIKDDDKNKQGQFIDSVHKQLQELETSFQKQISDLREMLFKGPKEKMQTESPKKKTEIKPLNYEVSYSSASSYKDGKRDIKEHIEMKNPELNLIADRSPDKEEFEVKIQKFGEKQPITQKMPARQLKKEIDKAYHDLQKKTKDDFKRLGLPLGRPSRSLFGSHDLPMLESSMSRLPIEKESGSSLLGSDRSLALRPAGTDFFEDEIRSIEREMDFMSRRMEDEMSRFFDL